MHPPVLRHGRAPGRRHAAGRRCRWCCPTAGAVPAEEHAAAARLGGPTTSSASRCSRRRWRKTCSASQRHRAAASELARFEQDAFGVDVFPRGHRRRRLRQASATAGRRRRQWRARCICARAGWSAPTAARSVVRSQLGVPMTGKNFLNPLAGGGHQGQGPGRRPAPPALLRLHLRPVLPDGEAACSQRPTIASNSC